jgi:putative transposase
VAWLQAAALAISWSGRKRGYDNIPIERLWRTVKDEQLFLHAYSDGWEAEISQSSLLWRYCQERPPNSLEGRTPDDLYTEVEPCSSLPGSTLSRARTVP